MTTLKIINRNIENIAHLKEEEIKNKNYDKYKYIFDEIIDILKNMNVLLYGGTAINDFLPSNLKIYDSQTLPDIDIFSMNAEKQAKIIEKKLLKKKFKAVSITEAIHPGTYKIYAEGLQIIDITNISTDAYKILSKNSTVGSLNIKIVNYEFLRLSLHMMLSQSEDAYRWSKVFNRLINYYTYMPPNKTNNSCYLTPTNFDNEYIKAINYIYSFLKNSDYILFGPNEINLINSNLNKYSIIPHIFVLVNTNNLETTTNSIINKLNRENYNFSLGTISLNNNFIYDFSTINYNNLPIMCIFKAETCMTYNSYNKFRIATINTIIRMYLGITLSNHPYFKKWENIFKCYIDKLSILLLKNKLTNKPLLKTFVKECYGKSESLITLRKNRILRIKK